MRNVNLFILASASVVTGCGTVEGSGKDFRTGGEAIEKAPEKAR